MARRGAQGAHSGDEAGIAARRPGPQAGELPDMGGFQAWRNRARASHATAPGESSWGKQQRWHIAAAFPGATYNNADSLLS